MKKNTLASAAIKAALMLQSTLGNFGSRDLRPSKFYDPQPIAGYKKRRVPKVQKKAGGKTHRRGYLYVRPAYR